MSMRVTLHFADKDVALEVREISGVERLGDPSRHELALFSAEPVAPSAVVGVPCAIVLENEMGFRTIHGKVTRFVRIATAQGQTGRRYRAVVEAAWALFRLGRASRVFQHVKVPDLVQKVLVGAGYAAGHVEQRLGESHAERECVAQWQEDDLRFVRSVGTRRPHRASREAVAGFRNAWSRLLQEAD